MAILGYAILARGLGHPVAASTFADQGTSTGLVARLEVDRTKDYRVKAALLFNSIQYTTWPRSALDKASDPIKVVVGGVDPFGDVLEKTFEGKTLHGRSITIERAKELPQELDAHLVFAGTLDATALPKLIAATGEKPVLLVDDRPNFAAQGAYLNSYEDGDKVRFDFNLSRKSGTKLELSSELLKLAQIVEAKEAVR